MPLDYTEDKIQGIEFTSDEIEGARGRRRPPPRPIKIGNPFANISRLFQPQRTTVQNVSSQPNTSVSVNEYIKRIQEQDIVKSENETRIKQLQSRVFQLEGDIQRRDSAISKKNKRIKYATDENSRLKKKNNTVLDNLRYFRSQVFGNKKVDGYNDVVVKQQIAMENLKKQEIGNPISKKEGFVTSGNAVYNAVVTQNEIVENQITNTINEHSVDNQLTMNILSKIAFMKTVNKILLFVFICTFIFGCYKVFSNTTMDLDMKAKIIISIGLFLTVVILHTIEYLFIHIAPFIMAFIIGTPHRVSQYWSKPGIYDYLPTK